MASSTAESLSLQLPFATVEKCSGISFDMGGSVLKIVYIDSREWSGIDGKQSGMVTLRFKSFSRTNLEEAVQFIKTLHVRRQSPDEAPTVYTTGVGLQNLGKRIETELNIKVENVMETDCFVRTALYCVKNLPEKVFSCEPSEEAIERGRARAKPILARYTLGAARLANAPPNAKMIRPRFDPEGVASLYSIIDEAATKNLSEAPIGQQEGAFPFLLGMSGSAMALMKVWEDGSYRSINLNQIGGRTFLSLGGLLTGVKNYEELMELARKGDERQLNSYLKDMVSSDGKGDGYSEAVANNMDLYIYALGKALGKDVSDFRKEDLASAVLHLVTHGQVLQTVGTILTDRCAHFVAAGSFPTADITRDIMVEEFLVLLAARGAWFEKPPKARLHIPKLGAYFGALGALLHGCQIEGPVSWF